MDKTEIINNEPIVVYNANRIIGVNEKGLQYKNDKGEKVSIDFQQCRKNWVMFVNSPGNFTSVGEIKESETKCIAWRDLCACPPWIEFFTQPRVRFNFVFLGISMDKKSRKLQKKILETGWTTYDAG